MEKPMYISSTPNYNKLTIVNGKQDNSASVNSQLEINNLKVLKVEKKHNKSLLEEEYVKKSNRVRKISTPIAIPRRKNSPSMSYVANKNRFSLSIESCLLQTHEHNSNQYGNSETDFKEKKTHLITPTSKTNGLFGREISKTHIISKMQSSDVEVDHNRLEKYDENLVKQKLLDDKSPLLQQGKVRRYTEHFSPALGRKSIDRSEDTPIMLRKKLSHQGMSESRKSSGNSSPVIMKKIVDYQHALERRFSGSSTSSSGNQDRKGSTDSNASLQDDTKPTDQSPLGPTHTNSPHLPKKIFSEASKANLANKKKSFVDMFEKMAVEGTVQRRRSAPNKQDNKSPAAMEKPIANDISDTLQKVLTGRTSDGTTLLPQSNTIEDVGGTTKYSNIIKSSHENEIFQNETSVRSQQNSLKSSISNAFEADSYSEKHTIIEKQSEKTITKTSREVKKKAKTIKRRKSVGSLPQLELFESQLSFNSEVTEPYKQTSAMKMSGKTKYKELKNKKNNRRKSVGYLSQISVFESAGNTDTENEKMSQKVVKDKKCFTRRKSVGCLSQIHLFESAGSSNSEFTKISSFEKDDKRQVQKSEPNNNKAEATVNKTRAVGSKTRIGMKSENLYCNNSKLTLMSDNLDKLSYIAKPEKKDSGNYEGDHMAEIRMSQRMFLENKSVEDTGKKINSEQRENGNFITVTRTSDGEDSDSSSVDYDSDCSDSSDSNYLARNSKVSVIERTPLSISAVSQIPARKKSQVMIAVGGIRKQDEESGFFDDNKLEYGNNLIVNKKEDFFAEDENPFRSHRFRSASLQHNYDNSNPNVRFATLGDLASGEMIGITTRTSSFNSSIGSYLEPCDNGRKSSQEEETPENYVKPRRKMGTVNIVSLDELPKRRMSRIGDWFQTMEEQHDSYESCYIPENISRKISMFGHYLTFDDLNNEGMEVVADKETRDIISVSHDTLSSCSEQVPYRSPSMYRSEISGHHPFDKLRIDEETSEHPSDEEDNESILSLPDDRSKTISDVESDSDESTETLNNDTHAVETEIDGSIEVGKEVQATDDALDDSKKLKAEEATITEVGGDIFEQKTHADEKKSTTFSTMFGYFNYCLYNFISKEYGIEKWREIIGSLNLSRRQVSMFEKPRHSMFDDAITDQVIRTASKTLNINFNLFLQKFGHNYFEFCGTKYGDILKSIATNLADFINNMDDIRRHIHKIEKICDDYPPSIYALLDKQGTLLLYYHSNRDQKYLEYFLIGFIKAAAWILYGMRSRVSLQQQRKDCEDYSVISIKAVTSLVKKPSMSKLQISSRCKDLIIEPYLMDSIFPFHIILNENLEMCQLGMSLNRLLENYIPTHGLQLEKYFTIVKPAIDLNYTSIKNNLNTAFILLSKTGMFKETFSTGLLLKGQVSYLESSKCLWFIGSPKVDFLQQLNGESNLYFSDIPLHDATREVLLVSEQTHEQDTLKSQLQVLTNRLKETSKDLALGKVNTENILDEIFPKDVAERLMRDLPVPAVTAAQVSILFTDIVGFTAICGKCDPEDVTDMLNNLYLEFDILCEKFNLYKVETIGDAYMAVGGLHRKDDEHGRLTTAMGIEMNACAKTVLTPDGESIQIRVGVHSGSVVAGVVGTRMPRYCLFGNDVALANKMESTSATGKIHISPTTYREIKHHQEFIFFERPRDVMPPLMQKLHGGNTYFVTQRRPSTYDIPIPEGEKRLKYMMPRRASEEQYIPASRPPPSRKTSYSESVMSDHQKYPPELRKQLDALEMLNGYQNGKVFCLPNIEA